MKLYNVIRFRWPLDLDTVQFFWSNFNLWLSQCTHILISFSKTGVLFQDLPEG